MPALAARLEERQKAKLEYQQKFNQDCQEIMMKREEDRKQKELDA